MSHSTAVTTMLKGQKALAQWCAQSYQAQGGELRLDSVKHGLPTSIFTGANPEVGI